MKNFERQVKLIYSRYTTKPRFSFEEVMDIFNYYFEVHKEQTGMEHKKPNAMQIKSIIDRLPECKDPAFDTPLELEPECYPPMIEHYYENYEQISNSDWHNPNIEHFLSGQIRGICFYETCY